MFKFFKILKIAIDNVSNFFACIMYKISKSLNVCKNYFRSKRHINILILTNAFFSIIIFYSFRHWVSIIYLILSLFLIGYEVIFNILIISFKTLGNLIIKIPDVITILGVIIFNLIIFLLLSFITIAIAIFIFAKFIVINDLFLFLIASLFASLLFMTISSFLFYNYYYKRHCENIVYYSINTFLNFIIGVCFTAIFGLKDPLTNYFEFFINLQYGQNFLSNFYNIYHFTISDIFTIILYWTFSLSLCYQTMNKVAKKVIKNQMLSEKEYISKDSWQHCGWFLFTNVSDIVRTIHIVPWISTKGTRLCNNGKYLIDSINRIKHVGILNTINMHTVAYINNIINEKMYIIYFILIKLVISFRYVIYFLNLGLNINFLNMINTSMVTNINFSLWLKSGKNQLKKSYTIFLIFKFITITNFVFFYSSYNSVFFINYLLIFNYCFI